VAVRAPVAVVAVAAALAGCTGQEAATPLPGGGGPAAVTSPSSTPSGSAGGPPPAGASVLTSGDVRLTVRPQDAARRQVLGSYLGFFAAYAEALGKADAASAELRRRTTADAFADFSRGIADNAKAGVTARGPVSLRPAVQESGAADLTVILVDCLDATRQRFYDRSGEPTGRTGTRRPIEVELINSPGPVRRVVGAVADGPPSACERSGS